MKTKGQKLLSHLVKKFDVNGDCKTCYEHFLMNGDEYSISELHDALCELDSMSDADFEKIINNSE